jgi:hypothetical protein
MTSTPWVSLTMLDRDRGYVTASIVTYDSLAVVPHQYDKEV